METPKETPAPTPKSSEDYVQAAIAGLKTQEPPADAPPADATPPADAPAAEETPSEEPKVEEKPKEEPSKEVPDTIKRSFEVLSRREAALRQEKQALEQERARLKPLLEAKDPLSALAAAGFTYKQLADQMIDGKFDPAKLAPEKKEAPADDDIRKEVAELKAQLAFERREKAKAEVVKNIKSTAAAGAKERFKFVTTMGEEDQARLFIEDYYRRTGELPEPGDMGKSIEIALEAVEKSLRKQADKWKPLLTGNSAPVTKVPEAPKSAGSQAASEEEAEKQHRTLTNSQSAAPRGTAPTHTVPKTDEEYREAALRALKDLEK